MDVTLKRWIRDRLAEYDAWSGKTEVNERTRGNTVVFTHVPSDVSAKAPTRAVAQALLVAALQDRGILPPRDVWTSAYGERPVKEAPPKSGDG